MGFNYNIENNTNGNLPKPAGNNEVYPKTSEVIPSIFAKTKPSKDALDWEYQFPPLSKMETKDKIKEKCIFNQKLSGGRYDDSGVNSLVKNGILTDEKLDKDIIDNRSSSDPTNNKQDGKIGSFKQVAGDCWFLAGLKVIGSTEEGDTVIKNSIKNNGNGTYTVSFKGAPGQKYTVSEKEIQNDERFSTGDKDVKILELAANKWSEKTRGRDLVSGSPSAVKMLILGKPCEMSIIDETAKIGQGDDTLRMNSQEAFDSIPEGRIFSVVFYTPKTTVLTISPKAGVEEFKTQTGEQIFPKHNYYAERQGTNIIMRNPHDTSKEPQIIDVREFLKENPTTASMQIEY